MVDGIEVTTKSTCTSFIMVPIVPGKLPTVVPGVAIAPAKVPEIDPLGPGDMGRLILPGRVLYGTGLPGRPGCWRCCWRCGGIAGAGWGGGGRGILRDSIEVKSLPGSPNELRQLISSLPSAMMVPGGYVIGNEGVAAGVGVRMYKYCLVSCERSDISFTLEPESKSAFGVESANTQPSAHSNCIFSK